MSTDHFQDPRPTSSHDIATSTRPDIKRAMSTPNLSINIPQPKAKFMANKGDVVPEEGEDDSEAELTAVSSICHSPGWDDAVTKKQKKEKEEAKKRKKKEAGKAAAKAQAQAKADAKQAEKEKRNRLSKVNPGNNTSRFSRLGMMINRSSSMPVVAQTREQSTSILEPMTVSSNLERPTSSMTQKTTKVWIDLANNSKNTPQRAASPIRQLTISPPSSPVNSQHGLRDNGISTINDTEQKYRYVDSDISQHAQHHPEPQNLNGSTDTQIHQDLSQQSITGDRISESERTSEQWESIYERAAHLMRSGQSKDRNQSRSRDPSTISNGGRKLRKKSHPPTTHHPANLDQEHTSRPSSSSCTSREASRQRASEELEGGNRPSSGHSSDQRGRSGSVHSQQHSDRNTVSSRVSQERSGQDKERQQSRGRRLSLTSMKNFIRSPSSGGSHDKDDNSDLGNLRAHSNRRPPTQPASRSHIIGSPSESGLHQRRSSSKSNLPGDGGLRHVAKASSNEKVPSISAADRELDAVHIRSISHGTNQHSRQASSISSVAQRTSKLERFFGQPVTAQFVGSPVDSQSPSTINTLSPAPSVEPRSQDSVESLNTQKSTMTFSEGHGTEDSSAITTPMQSSTELYKEEEESRTQYNDHVYDSKNGYDQGVDDSYVMSNAVRKSGGKPPSTPHPLSSRPTGDSSTVPALPAMFNDHLPPVMSGLEKPTPIRSISTPELSHQDLSFLPVLKHQPLPNSNKHSSVNLAVKKGEDAAQDQNRFSTPARVQHKPTPEKRDILKTPIATNYLQQARLSMATPMRPAPGLPKVGAAVDPIAKMFVVCCSCKYYHDMPSKIYECMAKSDNVVEDRDLGVHGVISTSVRCPWCNHGMTTACCAGYAAVVLLKERLH